MANYLDKSGLLRVLRGVKNQIERNIGELEATKGRPNGIASLDGKGFVPLAQLGNLDMTFFEPVQELPTKDIKKHIYLIKNTKEGEQDTYDEYLYTGDIDGEYDASKWEKLGDFVPTFDLKEYAKKKDSVNSISIRDIGNSSDAPDNFELGLYYINGDGEEKCVTIPTVTVGGVSTHQSGALRPYTGHNGLMTSEDKAKLDKIDTEALSQSITAANTAAGNTNEAIRKCETATAGAEKVNANLTDDNVVEITDRTGTTKSVSLDEAVKVGNDVTRIKQTLGAYSDREDIVLTPKETNKAISSDGVKVPRQGWAIAEFTAEKGNEYLFKPNVIDGSVCVFAEYITSIETRGIDYTYTYNEDGTIATATATYLGKTHVYTYEWTIEAGVNTPTIKEGDTVINNLPMTYETKVGTYSPLVKLNEDAELPVDGYCRYMSHFKGNSSIKIVVSYKVGIADLTMKVLRDGVLASISTQLGNLSQKEDETRKKVEEYHGSYAEFMFNDDTRIIVDGKNITIAARVKTRVYPKKSLVVGDRYSKKTLIYADVANLDTSGFTTFNAMFANCNILSELNLSAWDTSQVTSMASMFSGCSSLTSLNLSAWDTSQVTSMASMFSGCSSLTSLNLSAWDTTSLGKGEKESRKDTGIYMMFYLSYNIKTLDMGGDGWNFVNIPSSNSFYRPLESRALTEWKLGKNFFKGRFVNQYYDNNAFNNWSKSSFIESIVTNSYDRRANGYDDVTLYIAAKLKDYLSEDDIATMTAKGYIIA
jgi:surface protein